MPTLVIVVLTMLLTASLSAAVVSRVEKNFELDESAYDYSIASTTLAFVALGVVGGSMLSGLDQRNRNDHYLLLVLVAILIALTGLTYYTYDRLNRSQIDNSNTQNDQEQKVAFASFCFALIGLSVGFCYIVNSQFEERPNPMKIF